MTGAFDGLRAVVVGYGASGRAAARVLRAEGAGVLVSEQRGAAAVAADAAGSEDRWIEIRAGGHRPEHLDGADIVVTSPGVAEHAPILTWASERAVPVWSELELGARLARVPYVAVTGTNGKTTTVELLAAAMRAGGVRATACGNVGYPFSLAAREDGLDALVVEASSFQLRFAPSLHPDVSVLLNLAPDHLDWHGSFEEYAAAKARVFANQRGGDVHVGNAADDRAAAVSATAPCEVRWFSGDGSSAPRAPDRDRPISASVHGGRLAVALAGAPGSSATLDLGDDRTAAFAEDAAAATVAALAFGLELDAVASALATFRPGPHRGAVVATVEGVSFVDDSKATNPHAALASLRGRTGVVLIAGGLAKGVDLSPLRSASGSLSAVVAIGAAAEDVARVFEGLVPTERRASLEDAVRAAFVLARPGGTVLLAPACASQDMFRDYGERGDRFAAAASALLTSSERSHA